MTTQQITDLRKLLAEATPGPWRFDGFDRILSKDDEAQLATVYGAACQDQDGYPVALLLVAAVNALPVLLDAAEREQRLREALRELRQWAGSLQMSVVDTIPASTFAKVNAALAETEPTRGLDSKAKTV